MFSTSLSGRLKKLTDAAKSSYKKLEPFRANRLSAMKQFVGHHYGNNPAPDRVPINFLQMAVTTYVRKLVGRRPRVRCDTKFPGLEQYASTLKDAINETIQEMNLADTLEEIVLNALFGVGIAKVGLTQTADNTQGYLHDTGEPFVDSIDLSDWVHDMTAARQEAWQFCGNRYLLPREVVLSNPNYDVTAKNAVHSVGLQKRLEMDGVRRHDPHDIEQGKETEDDDLYDTVELWDYWLPREGLVVTMTEDSAEKPLATINWDGPEEGMYRLLSYQKVPNNVMPLPPVMNWLDLHELVNTLARKVGRQADRQKTITAAATTAEDDAKRVRDAADGEIISVTDPTLIRELRYGGADPATVALMEQMRSHANYQAGNIEAMSGLAPQSGTVGQDELLHSSASEVMLDMQEKTQVFVEKVCRDIGYYLFTDPTGVKLVERRFEGLDMTFPAFWGPDQRVGKWYQYNVQIVPYSLQPQSPTQKLQLLNGLVDRFGPMLQIMLQQGWTIDFNRLISLTSNLSDMPELAQVLVPADPNMAGSASADQQGPKMPRSTVREYVRTNRGGQKNTGVAQFAQMAASQAAMQNG